MTRGRGHSEQPPEENEKYGTHACEKNARKRCVHQRAGNTDRAAENTENTSEPNDLRAAPSHSF